VPAFMPHLLTVAMEISGDVRGYSHICMRAQKSLDRFGLGIMFPSLTSSLRSLCLCLTELVARQRFSSVQRGTSFASWASRLRFFCSRLLSLSPIGLFERQQFSPVLLLKVCEFLHYDYMKHRRLRALH